jgi:hypothetical protein
VAWGTCGQRGSGLLQLVVRPDWRKNVARLMFRGRKLSGTIIRGTLKTPNSQLVTPISIKLQRPDGYD